jgi:cell division protein FtsA
MSTVRRNLRPTRTGPVAALDVGTTKVCCFIARPDGADLPRIIGIGHQVAKGVRNGSVVDMEAAEASIRATVEAAEQMAGTTVRRVLLNVSGGAPASRTVRFEVSVAGYEIGDGDVRRALRQSRQLHAPQGRDLIHAIPTAFSIDGSRGIRDPRGMFGERLGVDMHVVTAGAGPTRNLTTCVRRCHLDVEALAVAPYAAGLAALVQDEMELGVTVIDMGGGATTLAVFFDGAAVYTDSVPLGGVHVTNDVARMLSTPLTQAERLKTLYGHCLASAVDRRELIEVPAVGDSDREAANQVPRKLLVDIVRTRVEETLEMVRDRLAASGFDKRAGRRVVLTGGASQLPGLRELAARLLDRQVRMGRPIRIRGLAEATGGPAFATCAGLVTLALHHEPAAAAQARLAENEPTGWLGRLGLWLRESF